MRLAVPYLVRMEASKRRNIDAGSLPPALDTQVRWQATDPAACVTRRISRTERMKSATTQDPSKVYSF